MERWQSWSIATVLKTVDCNRSVGSNPTLSAVEFARGNGLIGKPCRLLASKPKTLTYWCLG